MKLRDISFLLTICVFYIHRNAGVCDNVLSRIFTERPSPSELSFFTFL